MVDETGELLLRVSLSLPYLSMGCVGSFTDIRHNRAVTRLAEHLCVFFRVRAGGTCFHDVKLHILIAFQMYSSSVCELNCY